MLQVTQMEAVFKPKWSDSTLHSLNLRLSNPHQKETNKETVAVARLGISSLESLQYPIPPDVTATGHHSEWTYRLTRSYGL